MVLAYKMQYKIEKNIETIKIKGPINEELYISVRFLCFLKFSLNLDNTKKGRTFFIKN